MDNRFRNTNQRPAGVAILAVYWLLSGIVTLIGVLLSVLGGFSPLVIFSVLTGIVSLAVAYGLWSLKPWGFWSAALIAALYILQAILSIMFGSFSTNVLLPLVLNIIVIFYLFADRSVRAAFQL